MKWVGGKRQLLAYLRRFYPPAFQSYIEPFLGGGAVFLDLHNHGLLENRNVYLSDLNPDVIGCYIAVRDSVGAVIKHLQKLELQHAVEGRHLFLQVRNTEFNPWRASEAPKPEEYPARMAAVFIYLNKTGYNGMYRVNGKGHFNVPPGRQAKGKLFDEANMRRLAAVLGRKNINLRCVDFAEAVHSAGENDFAYLDPPYAPINTTARFTGYTLERFTSEDQERLKGDVLGFVTRGGLVLLSNSAVSEVRRLYVHDKLARSAGLRAVVVPARRAINSVGAARGPVNEYLISNVSTAAATLPWPPGAANPR